MTADDNLRDRARGTVLGSAVGDALGAAYEFGTAEVGPSGPEMLGGGLGDFAPGEWTDDTTMAWCILDAAALHEDLTSDDALTRIARSFRRWYDTGPADIGNQTRTLLSVVGPDPTAAALTRASADLHARTGHTGGNGSLMRTAPVALRHLDDEAGLVRAARRISALTHWDPQAQDACVLWSVAIRRAILEACFDVRSGLVHLDPAAAQEWSRLIDEAEQREPSTFTPNGWVVSAFQAALSSISHTTVPTEEPSRHFGDSLETAIRIGNDTDTVAAIAGALLGARWGAAAIPGRWRTVLHGYPGITGEDLVALVDRTLS